jgi:hypothetical protein
MQGLWEIDVTIKHDPNRTSILRGNRSGHHNTELNGQI